MKVLFTILLVLLVLMSWHRQREIRFLTRIGKIWQNMPRQTALWIVLALAVGSAIMWVLTPNVFGINGDWLLQAQESGEPGDLNWFFLWFGRLIVCVIVWPLWYLAGPIFAVFIYRTKIRGRQ